MASLDELARLHKEQKDKNHATMMTTTVTDIKMWTTVGMFLISLLGAFGAYLKSIADIREEIHSALYKSTESIRVEVRELYTTKEEAKFIQKNLEEIKSDLKEIKNAVRR